MQDFAALAERNKLLWSELGFHHLGNAGVSHGDYEPHRRDSLAKGTPGSMDDKARHGDKRTRPDHIAPGTIRVI
jgi:epoxyqueuosine reductase QueG